VDYRNEIMHYDELLRSARLLDYRDKLRLAHFLIQLALQEGAGSSADSIIAQASEQLADPPRLKDCPQESATAIDPNRPWVGLNYPQRRIFVVGESYTGTHDGDLEYDDAYMAALLAGKKVLGPELFIKMANKLGMQLSTFWQQVAFTNMAIGSIGASDATKVTPAQLRAGQPRLESLFRLHKPKGVLILGIKTGDAVAPVCKRLGITHRTVYHPSGVNNANPKTACSSEMLKAAWSELTNDDGRDVA
jgi:hypothetical protein